MAWQPIETAPQDGSPVLAYDPTWYDVPHPMLWNGATWCLWFQSDRYDGFRPTHWMPLPEPPAE